MKDGRAVELLETIGKKFPGLVERGEHIVDVCNLINHLTKVMKEVYPKKISRVPKRLKDLTQKSCG